MRVIDLSHTIHPGMPVFPGTEPPRFELANTLEKDGFIEKKITLYSHTGTHIDVPAHLIGDGRKLHEFAAEHFVGTGIIIDVTDLVRIFEKGQLMNAADMLPYADTSAYNKYLSNSAGNSSRIISLDRLLPFAQCLQETDFVLLRTGWSQYWGSERYFKDFPALSQEAAEWLAGFELKGVGIDTISIDDIDAAEFSIHLTFLRRNIIVIENLTNLDHPGFQNSSTPIAEKFMFSCLPLKISEGDGSPVRAIAVIGSSEEY